MILKEMEILILINSEIPYNKKSHPEMRSVFRYGMYIY